jgi:tetratricopeptide (TPR) repeat protein
LKTPIKSKPEAEKAFFLFAGLGILIYFNSLGNGFVFDDNHYVTQNHLIKNLDILALKEVFSSFYKWDYLPLTHISLSVDYFLFGLNPMGYRITNISLHIINAFLTHQLILFVLGNKKIALWTGLLFLVHPVNVESVAWVSERKNVLSLTFLLLSFIKYIQNKRTFSIFCFILACLSKSTAIVLPILLILYDSCFKPREFRKMIFDKWGYALISFCLAGITVLSHSQGQTLRTHPENNPLFSLYSMIPVFKEYWLKIAFPINLNVWYQNLIYKSVTDIVGSLIFAVGFFYFLFKIRKSSITIFFGLSWFCISLLPVSHIVPLPQMQADRFLYIPSIGAFLVFSYLIDCLTKFFSAKNTRNINFDIFIYINLIIFSCLCLYRLPIFKNDFDLWKDSVRQNPNHSISVMYLGLTHWGRKEFDQALAQLKKAKSLNSKNIISEEYQGLILESLGKFSEAESVYLGILKKHPERASTNNHLGVLYGAMEKTDEALKRLAMAIQKKPDFALAHYNRAVFLYKLGNQNEAFQEFKLAAKLAPNNTKFQYQLGLFYLKVRKEENQANFHIRKSIRLNPNRAIGLEAMVLLEKNL